MKHFILALLAATFSLSVMAESINLNSPRSNVVERGKPTKEQTAREVALQGPDTCNIAIDEAGVKRQATEQQQKICKDGKGKMPAYGKSGIAVGDADVLTNDLTKPKK